MVESFVGEVEAPGLNAVFEPLKDSLQLLSEPSRSLSSCRRLRIASSSPKLLELAPRAENQAN